MWKSYKVHVFLILMVCLLISANLVADQKLVYKMQRDEFRGVPAFNGNHTIYVSATLGVKYEVANEYTIFYDAKKMEVFVLFPEQKQN